MPLTPEEQALVNELNQRFPRFGDNPPEIEFRRVSVDQQVDDFMRGAKNAHDFRTQRLMVPSTEELEYRAGIRPPTTGTPRPEVVPYQPTSPYKPTSQTPTPYQPTSVDRFPRPSGGSPPPTPTTSGMGARTAMIEPPPTAAPRAPTVATNPTPGARPSGLPVPAGRFSPPVVGAAADIGFRIIAGQPPTQVVVGGAGNLAGGIVGSLLGGPVGGMVGGFAGGQLADYAYRLFAPKKAEIPVAPKTGKVPFNGGQGKRVAYVVRTEFDNPLRWEANSDLWGPILGSRARIVKRPDGLYNGTTEVLCHGAIQQAYKEEPVWFITGQYPNYDITRNHYIATVVRVDGKVDTDGDPTPLAAPKDTRNPDSIGHPGNQNFSPPSATPAASSNPAPNNYVPGV